MIDWGYIKYILRKTRRYKKGKNVPEILYYEALVVKEAISKKLVYDSQNYELERWLNSVDTTTLTKKKMYLVRSRELGERKIGIKDIFLCLISYLPYYVASILVILLSESVSFWEFVINSSDIIGFPVLIAYVMGVFYIYLRIVGSMLDVIYALFKGTRSFLGKYSLVSQKIKCKHYITLDTIKKDLAVGEYDLTYQELCDLDIKLLKGVK